MLLYRIKIKYNWIETMRTPQGHICPSAPLHPHPTPPAPKQQNKPKTKKMKKHPHTTPKPHNDKTENTTGYRILEEKVMGTKAGLTSHLGFLHILLKTVISAILIYIIGSVIPWQINLYSKLSVPLALRILANSSCKVQFFYRKQKLLNYPSYFDSALSAQSHYQKSTYLMHVPMKDLGQVCLNSIQEKTPNNLSHIILLIFD